MQHGVEGMMYLLSESSKLMVSQAVRCFFSDAATVCGVHSLSVESCGKPLLCNNNTFYL